MKETHVYTAPVTEMDGIFNFKKLRWLGANFCKTDDSFFVTKHIHEEISPSYILNICAAPNLHVICVPDPLTAADKKDQPQIIDHVSSTNKPNQMNDVAL